MLDEVGVVPVRTFRTTKTTLGIGCDDGSYYVYDRPFTASAFAWHMHCGPYSTFDQAVEWIRAIRDEPQSGAAVDPSVSPEGATDTGKPPTRD